MRIGWLLSLLLLAVPLAGATGRVASAPIATLADQPGRLRNAAQQALARGDVHEATRILGRILEDDPQDGFSHALLAQALVFGLDLGPEAAAAWRSAVEQHPERPELVAFAALAELEAHREDRFLGPESGWFRDALLALEAALPGAPPRAGYELLLARRALLSLVRQRDEAREAGLRAHDLWPRGLQGRLSALAQARVDGDIARELGLCLSVLRSDPWAAEACSTLWAESFPDDPVARAGLMEAQHQVLGQITALEDRWLTDPVVANELLTFRSRIQDPQGQRALLDRIVAANPAFHYHRQPRWWRRGVIVGAPYRAMNIATNRSRGLPPAERLAALLAHWEAVPGGGDDDWALQRYLEAVAEAAGEAGDRDRQGVALEARLLGQPDDPAALLALARFRAEEPAGREEALALVRRSAEALLRAPWDPMEAASHHRIFSDHVQALREGLAVRRTLEATLAAPTIDDQGLPSTVSAWLTWADAAADPVLALHGGLEGLSLLPPQDLERLPASILETSMARLRAAMPALDALGVDARLALIEAAEARARDRANRAAGEGKPQHPFVGHPAPRWSARTLGGVDLDTDNQRGRVVVLDFWATWCGPCAAELPHLQAVADRLGDAPVTFLLASVDSSPDPVAPFLTRAGLRFDAAWIGEDGMKQRWQVRGIPSLFVVDAQGVVRYQHQGFRPDIAELLEGEICGLLAEVQP